MENFNINLDRPKISSEEINSKQNFDKLLSQYGQTKTPAYRNPWFWGSAGLASVGLTTVLSLSALTLKNETDDKKITLKNNQLPQDTECVKPPVKEEQVAYKTYQVDPNKDEKIVLESGTTIEIDKGSLQAQKPGEKVEIKVREFHDAASVFVSGIPMDYKKDAFESAGMIEIKGEQHGQEVKINPEKPIDIAMVTDKNPESFDFWYLNQANKSWESYPLTTETATKENSASNKATLESKIKATENKIAAVQTELSSLEKPTVYEYKIPKKSSQQFDLNFDKKEYPELASFKNVIFEVMSQNGNDPNFLKNTKKTWSQIDLKKKDNQYMAYFKSSNDSYTLQVRPILQGTELANAEKEFDQALQKFETEKTKLEVKKKELTAEQKNYQSSLDQLIKNQLKDQDTRLASENRNVQEVATNFNKMARDVAEFTSTLNFQTTKWGIYNCDKPINYPKALGAEVALLWLGDQVAKFKQLFVFNKDKNLRYSYGEGYRPLESLGFHNNDDIVLIGIDQEGNIGYCEIKKDDQVKGIAKISFQRKGKETKTLDLLKKLLDETTDTV